MAIALNWHRIYIHSARQHAWQISDVRHMTSCHTSHRLSMINVNERDEGEAQSIRLHRQDSRVEIVGWQVDRWLMPFVRALDTVPVPSWSGVVWINSVGNKEKKNNNRIKARWKKMAKSSRKLMAINWIILLQQQHLCMSSFEHYHNYQWNPSC